jgi:hypothetical protein
MNALRLVGNTRGIYRETQPEGHTMPDRFTFCVIAGARASSFMTLIAKFHRFNLGLDITRIDLGI